MDWGERLPLETPLHRTVVPNLTLVWICSFFQELLKWPQSLQTADLEHSESAAPSSPHDCHPTSLLELTEPLEPL